jgi:hypothetical protein
MFYLQDVYHWLKGLRLHKYAQHFANVTYEQMLNLNDDQLIGLNITLGARKKILVNLEKIQKRKDRLIEIHKVGVNFSESKNIKINCIRKHRRCSMKVRV